MKTLIALSLLFCSLLHADIIPNVPDRHLDATAALQAALDQSGKTGEPVKLAGTYVTKSTLTVAGSIIVGQLASHSGNWGPAVLFTSTGSATIYAQHGGDVLVCKPGPATTMPNIRDLAIVAFHSSQRAPFAAGISVTGARTCLTADNLLVDGAGIGLLFGRGTSEHRISKVTVRSARSVGIRFEDGIQTPDCWFRDIYVTGVQHPDYVANPPATGPLPVGIDGLPCSSAFYGRTLVEWAQTAVRTGRVLNTYFDDLMIDACLGTGIEVSEPYPSKDYLKELSISRLHMQASVPSCVPWKWAGTGLSKTTVRVGADRYSTIAPGSWVNSALRPAQIVFLPFQQ